MEPCWWCRRGVVILYRRMIWPARSWKHLSKMPNYSANPIFLLGGRICCAFWSQYIMWVQELKDWCKIIAPTKYVIISRKDCFFAPTKWAFVLVLVTLDKSLNHKIWDSLKLWLFTKISKVAHWKHYKLVFFTYERPTFVQKQVHIWKRFTFVKIKNNSIASSFYWAIGKPRYQLLLFHVLCRMLWLASTSILVVSGCLPSQFFYGQFIIALVFTLICLLIVFATDFASQTPVVLSGPVGSINLVGN